MFFLLFEWMWCGEHTNGYELKLLSGFFHQYQILTHKGNNTASTALTLYTKSNNTASTVLKMLDIDFNSSLWNIKLQSLDYFLQYKPNFSNPSLLLYGVALLTVYY